MELKIPHYHERIETWLDVNCSKRSESDIHTSRRSLFTAHRTGVYTYQRPLGKRLL